jgi:hypothetical protein
MEIPGVAGIGLSYSTRGSSIFPLSGEKLVQRFHGYVYESWSYDKKRYGLYPQDLEGASSRL